MKLSDIDRAGPLADTILDAFAAHQARPEIACAALAIVLGQVAVRFGVPLGDLLVVVAHSAALSAEAA